MTDGRGGVAGWVASVLHHLHPAGTRRGEGPAVLYATPAATVTGTATVTAQNADGPIVVMPLPIAILVTGASTATWNPAVTVHVPAGAQPGVLHRQP